MARLTISHASSTRTMAWAKAGRSFTTGTRDSCAATPRATQAAQAATVPITRTLTPATNATVPLTPHMLESNSMRRRWFSRLVTAQCLTLSGLTLSGLLLADPDLQAGGADTVWDGVYSAAQAARGEKAYMRACGGCHRDDASGGDDSEPALRGPNFTHNWDGTSVAVLYDFIATNMPRTRPGSVPLEECVDIVAFLLKLNEMPAGTRELTTDIKALSAIRFTATKPAQ